MRLSSDVEVSHPYIASIVRNGNSYDIVLSEAFPIEFRKFTLQATPMNPFGYMGVEGNLGLIEELGRVFWLCGDGRTLEEAVQGALATFVNWVVHPADVNASHFCLRAAAA